MADTDRSNAPVDSTGRMIGQPAHSCLERCCDPAPAARLEPWDGYEDECDECVLRRLRRKIDECEPWHDQAYALALASAVRDHEILKRNGLRAGEPRADTVEQEAKDQVMRVMSWQRS